MKKVKFLYVDFILAALVILGTLFFITEAGKMGATLNDMAAAITLVVFALVMMLFIGMDLRGFDWSKLFQLYRRKREKKTEGCDGLS